MSLERDMIAEDQSTEPHKVSGRFLSDLFRALEKRDIPARRLVGDLPIRLGESGDVLGDVDWNHFRDVMGRLERHLDGPAGLDACGDVIRDLAPGAALRSLAGMGTSPVALFQAATRWALRRALPGVEARIDVLDSGRIEIHTSLADGLPDCPQIFHFATGASRALPGLIGLRDAVVSATITPRSAVHRIILPPSLTLFARIKRRFRAIFSSGAVLNYLEAQQLELHSKNDALQRALDVLAESERRYKTITDAAVDVLCEIEDNGRIAFVSRSIQDLIGYAPEQVMGSHFRLWVPRKLHQRVNRGFQSILAMPDGSATQKRLVLHAEHGEAVAVELTARCYTTSHGAGRVVCILRDRSDRHSGLHRSALRSARSAKSAAPDVGANVIFAPETFEQARWLETHKLLRSARDMFLSSATSIGFDVGIDTEDLPAEIWAEESQLLVGLVRLLDWAAQSRDSSRSGQDPRMLLLGAGTTSDKHGGGPSIFIEISTDASGRNSEQPREAMGHGDEESERPDRLALALATEAITTLGGRLLHGEVRALSGAPPDSRTEPQAPLIRQVLKRVELPQPRIVQPARPAD